MRISETSLVQTAALLAFALLSTARAVEVPRRADEFVDSIGINTHIDVSSSVYNEAVIGQSGIRHFRSSVKPGMTTLQSRLSSLYANYGTHVNLACDTTDIAPWQYRDLAKDPMFESVEGLNEPDVAGPRSYAGLCDVVPTQSYGATIKFQKDLFAAMGADPATLAKDVISPAMANPANSSALQGVPADYIGMHSYPGQEMPTGNFLSSFAIPGAQSMSGATPMRIVATETGYRSGTAWGDISATATKKYVPRLFAEYFRLGIVRTYLFEMSDASYYNFGLLDCSFSPKPAYFALKNLIGLLTDSQWNATTKTWSTPQTFYPSSVDYTLTTPSANVHHVLLQKANGKLYLLLWQEVPSFDLLGVADIANPTVPVDLNFNLGIATASIYNLNSNLAQATYSNVASLRVNVADEITIVELTPGVTNAVSATGQVAAINTTVANTSAVTGQQGLITVTRSGSTSSPLTVYYTTSGTAVAGTDYDPLPGSVTIPAGASTAPITVNPRNAAIVGRKNLLLTINSDSAYGISLARSASVYFGNSRNVVSDFDSSIAGWHGNAGATTTWNSAYPDTGAGAMQVTFMVNGVDRWINNFETDFATPQDWKGVSKLVLRVKESALNPTGDLGKPVYFTWWNNGTDVSGGYGVAKFPLTGETGYRTVTLDLGNFPRDKVTGLFFYVDGSVLPVGSHSIYLDNVTAISDTNGVLEDFEEYGVSNWSHGSLSAASVETAVVDTGVQSMRWTFTANGQHWDNYVKLDFKLPADLSQCSTIRFRFKEDQANPASDVGARVYFDWFNNGARANGDAGLTSFQLQPASGGYRTIEISISAFKRDSLNAMFFYIDGASFASGVHTWYLDNISYY